MSEQNIIGLIVLVAVIVIGRVVKHITKKKLEAIDGVGSVRTSGETKKDGIFIE
jgi:hypothetical protein